MMSNESHPTRTPVGALDPDRVSLALLSLRAGIFITMLAWTADKFVQSEHAAAVFRNFYGLESLGAWVFPMLGSLELLLIGAFLIGFAKRFTYGAVLLLHGISTLSSYQQYLDPFRNLLFFAAWPMLAACFTLYLLRDADTRFTVGGSRAR